MFKKIFTSFVRRHHFWRTINLDEMSDLYVSMTLRGLALGLIGVFVPFFLYELGIDMTGIAVFYVLFFMARTTMDPLAGLLVARFGPKHIIVLSYLLQTLTSLLFFSLDSAPSVYYLPALTWGLSNSLFFIAFHVDFSKIKHSNHGGKEYGLISAVERLGGAISPLIGGFIAFLFGPQYIFLFAFVILFLGLMPLFRAPEPTRTRQHISYQGLPFRKIKWDLISYAATTAENNLRIIIWPLYLALFALGADVYLKLGTLSSLGLFASVVSAYWIGQLIDKKSGRKLLNVTSYASSLMNISRIFVSTLPFAVVVNMVGEILTTGHRIPYHKGMYDKADQLTGNRIAFVGAMEMFASGCKLIIWSLLLAGSLYVSAEVLLQVGFLVTALLACCIPLQRYRGLE